jgi:hypothetical protein
MSVHAPPARRFLRAAVLTLALATATATPRTAQAALASDQAGVWLHVGGGLGAGDAGPFRGGVGWTLGFGGWYGRYDDAFSIGRQLGFGAVVRQDVIFREDLTLFRTAPMLHVYRGIDLLVVGLEVGGSAGPLLETLPGAGTQVTGGTVRAMGALNYRFHPRWSAFARLEAGVDIEPTTVQASVGFFLGLKFATPLRRKS